MKRLIALLFLLCGAAYAQIPGIFNQNYYRARQSVEVQVSRLIGTNIGNATGSGGIAACFDGVTNATFASANSCSLASNPNYVGKQYSTGKVFSRAIVYGSNDSGFCGTGTPTVTIDIYGNNKAPVVSNDGTKIGTITFTNTLNESAGRFISSSDKSNSYTYIWERTDCGATTTSGETELVLYEVIYQ